MKRYYKYLSYVFRHKWFVFLEGRKLGISSWHLFWHDWTKFLPLELISYAHTFRDSKGNKQYIPHKDFNRAWNSHEKMHKHHWQYWVLIKDTGELVPLEIPERHKKEMLADWKGAGRALGFPDTAKWYNNNSDNIMLHDNTRLWIESQLYTGYWYDKKDSNE
jgi:hypothetical protein